MIACLTRKCHPLYPIERGKSLPGGYFCSASFPFPFSDPLETRDWFSVICTCTVLCIMLSNFISNFCDTFIFDISIKAIALSNSSEMRVNYWLCANRLCWVQNKFSQKASALVSIIHCLHTINVLARGGDKMTWHDPSRAARDWLSRLSKSCTSFEK